MLSKLREAWALANAVSKSLARAKKETQRDLQHAFMMKAEMENENLKALLEEIAKEVKK
jgi:hypothetical protein